MATYDRAEVLRDLTQYLQEKHGGRAWFNGGSYSYLLDTAKPTEVTTSDDGAIQCGDLLEIIEGWADRGICDDFVACWPEDWAEFFRADVRGQEDHELRNLRGDA